MYNDTIKKFYPYANSVEFCVKDLTNNCLVKFTMKNEGYHWILDKNLLKPHIDSKYYYLVNNNFVLTDSLKENMKPEVDLPSISYLFDNVFTDSIKPEFKNIIFSKDIAKDLTAINKTNHFSSLDKYIYIRYIFNRLPETIRLVLCLSKNNTIFTIHNIIARYNTQNILYTIHTNENLTSGNYRVSLSNDSILLEESDFYYNKLSTYSNKMMNSVNLEI